MEQPDLLTPIIALNEQIKQTLIFFEQLDPSDLTKLLLAFGKLRDAKGLITGMSETIDSLYKKYDYEVVPNVLEANEIDSISVGGKLFSLATRVNASIPENKREVGNKWLQDVGASALIKPTVNPRQLSSFVKDYFNENGKWPPDDAVTVHKQTYVQVRST